MDRRQRVRSFDEILDAVAHVQRRRLLRALLEHNPQDDEPSVLDADESVDEEFDRLLEMRHVHLPKLAEYGFVVWDRESSEVSKGPNFDEIRPLLELLAEHEDELPEHWL